MSEPLERALLLLDPIVVVNDVWGPMTYAQLHAQVGYTKSKENLEVRRLLQVLGTEIGRDMIHADVWVDIAFKTIDELTAIGTSVALTGVRFANELAAVRKRGGLAVWIDRGLAPVNMHPSDNALGPEDFDLIVKNEGTIWDLHNKIRDVVATSEREEIYP